MEELMEKPWFEKHRPLSIDDVVFESVEIEQKIKAFINQGYIQGNIISYGPGGVGKTTLNKILLESIAKSNSDFFVLGKGVESIENLKPWLLNNPLKSKQKIVICEEFDLLSSRAQTSLKNGMMENFMPGVAFIVTTNNIHGIDSALLQRFNEKISFNSFNVEGCLHRMKNILAIEQVQYIETELVQIVEAFKNKGIRDLINNLQAGTINKVFSLNNIQNNFVSTSGVEDLIISYIKYFNSYLLNEPDLNQVYTICTTPQLHPTINEYYSPMLKMMEIDPGINYEYIYNALLEDIDVLLPLKKIITKYYQESKLIPLANIHLQSCMYEMFANIYFMRGGEHRLIL